MPAAASQARGRHQATWRAACICRSAACSGQTHALACSSTAAQSAHVAAGVGGAHNEHGCHIILMIMPSNVWRAAMCLLCLRLTSTLCSVHLDWMQVPLQQPADGHPASGVVGAGWPVYLVGAVRAAHPRAPPCCERSLACAAGIWCSCVGSCQSSKGASIRLPGELPAFADQLPAAGRHMH